MEFATRQKMTVDQAVTFAYRQQVSGALEEARRAYERILVVAPGHPTALTMLASIAYQRGDDILGEAYVERAVEVYRGRLAVHPGGSGQTAALVNLLLSRGRIAEAERLITTVNLPLNPIRATPEAFEARRRQAQRTGLPPMLLITVPKSASESIWNLLAERLGFAQSHVSIGLFPDCCLVPPRVRQLAAGGVIAKEHILPTAHNLRVLQAHGIDRLLVHLRDPRQAMLSWAHFVRDDVSRRALAPIWRKIVPPAGVLETGLGATLDWCLEHYLPRLVEFMTSWLGLATDPRAPVRVRCLTFEQFRTAPEHYFEQALALYAVDHDRFNTDAKAEVVHLRRGALDEWREVLTRRQQRRARQAIPDSLAAMFERPA